MSDGGDEVTIPSEGAIDVLLGDDGPGDGPSAKKLVRGIGVPGGIAILFVLLRILAVSHWNWDTATSIAGTIDLQSIFQMAMGTLFARPGLTGLVVMILLPLVVFSLVWPTPGESRWHLTPMLFATVLAAIAVSRVVSSRSWWLPIGVLVIGGVLVAVYRRYQGVLEHRFVVLGKRSVNVAILVAVLILAATIDTPWLERERIVVTPTSVSAVFAADALGGSPDTVAVTGYVLEVQPGFTRILTDGRDVVILRSNQIMSREVIDP